MKKILLITLLALAGCTSSQLPNDAFSSSKGIEEEKIRTKGHMNGYSIKANDLIEGRTKGANYKRLLINNGEEVRMTVYAYDVKMNGEYIDIYIWSGKNARNLYYSLWNFASYKNHHFAYHKWMNMFTSYLFGNNHEVNNFICDKIHIKASCLTMFNKDEATKYLRDNQDTLLFERC
jgi:hypothetical protein